MYSYKTIIESSISPPADTPKNIFRILPTNMNVLIITFLKHQALMFERELHLSVIRVFFKNEAAVYLVLQVPIISSCDIE
jgi:hypothetical protein